MATPAEGARPSAVPAGFTTRRPQLLTLVLCASVSPLAINVFAPSMPRMAAEFGVPYAIMQLGLSYYLVMTAVLQLFCGPLSDYVGRRPVMVLGMSLFLVGGAICLAADSIEWFLFGRVLQAASAAGVVLSRAVVRDLFDRDSAASMISYVAMGMAVAPMIGPAIGGFLDELYGWQASFLMLVALGVVTLGAVFLNLPETNLVRRRPREQLAAYAALAGSSRYWCHVGATACASCAFFIYLGGGPMLAIRRFGMSAAEYGLWFTVCAVGYMLGSFLSGRYARRIGIEVMLLYGAGATSAAALLATVMLLGQPTGPMALFVPLFLVGFGSGITIPNAAAGAVSVVHSSAGAAAGVIGAIQMCFGALASFAGGAVVGNEGNTVVFCLLLVALALAGIYFSVVLFVRSPRLPRKASEGPLGQ